MRKLLSTALLLCLLSVPVLADGDVNAPPKGAPTSGDSVKLTVLAWVLAIINR